MQIVEPYETPSGVSNNGDEKKERRRLKYQKIVAYLSLLRCSQALRSDQLPKILAYLSLLRWSHALRSDQQSQLPGLAWDRSLKKVVNKCVRK